MAPTAAILVSQRCGCAGFKPTTSLSWGMCSTAAQKPLPSKHYDILITQVNNFILMDRNPSWSLMFEKVKAFNHRLWFGLGCLLDGNHARLLLAAAKYYMELYLGPHRWDLNTKSTVWFGNAEKVSLEVGNRICLLLFILRRLCLIF